MGKLIIFEGKEASRYDSIFGILKSEHFVRAYATGRLVVVEGVYPFSGEKFSNTISCVSEDAAKKQIEDIYKAFYSME